MQGHGEGALDRIVGDLHAQGQHAGGVHRHHEFLQGMDLFQGLVHHGMDPREAHRWRTGQDQVGAVHHRADVVVANQLFDARHRGVQGHHVTGQGIRIEAAEGIHQHRHGLAVGGA